MRRFCDGVRGVVAAVVGTVRGTVLGFWVEPLQGPEDQLLIGSNAVA